MALKEIKSRDQTLSKITKDKKGEENFKKLINLVKIYLEHKISKPPLFTVEVINLTLLEREFIAQMKKARVVKLIQD